MGCSDDPTEKFCGMPTNKLTCEQVEQCYEQCDKHFTFNRTENCRGRYLPAIIRCYGCKK